MEALQGISVYKFLGRAFTVHVNSSCRSSMAGDRSAASDQFTDSFCHGSRETEKEQDHTAFYDHADHDPDPGDRFSDAV